MSTSLLYHAFGIQGYRYVRTRYVQGQTIFTLGQGRDSCRCSACGSADVVSRGRVERRFRCLPIGTRPTSLVLPVPRVECRACGVVRQVDVAFADPPSATDAADRLVALFRRGAFARILSVEHPADRRVDGDETRRYGDTAVTFCRAP